MVRVRGAAARLPIAAILPSRIPMSPEYQGEPVPSMIWPLVMTMSNAAGNPAFTGRIISEKRRVRVAALHCMQMACLMNLLQLRARARAKASVRDFHFDFRADPQTLFLLQFRSAPKSVSVYGSSS